MGRADDIVFRMNADTSRFTRGINSAGTALKGFIGGAIAALSVSALKDIVSSVAEIGKKASRVALTTDALQELRYAGELAGVSVNNLDIGMQRFARRIAEIASGKQNDLSKVLDANGVSLTDVDGKLRSQIDILGDYAELLKGVSSEADRTRLAFLAFDSEGVSMVNMLKDGREGLTKTREEFRKLGGVIDNETIKSAEELEDRIMRITTGLSRMALKATIGIVGAADRAIGFVASTLDSEFELSQLEVLEKRLGTLKDRFERFGATVDEVRQGLMTTEIQRLESLISIIKSSSDLGDGVLTKKTIIPETETPEQKATRIAHEKAVRAAASLGESRARTIEQVISALKREHEALSQSEQQQRVVNELHRAGVDVTSAAGEKIRDLVTMIEAENRAVEQSRETYERFEEQQRKMQYEASQLFDVGVSLGDAFAQGADEGVEALKRLAAQLAIAIVKAQVMKALGFGGNIASPLANAAFGAGKIGLFAKGGVTNQPSIFGEGPGWEAAVPLPDGRSIPVKFTDVPNMARREDSMHITLGISENNGNLTPFIESIARKESASTVENYDRHILPSRVIGSMKKFNRGGNDL